MRVVPFLTYLKLKVRDNLQYSAVVREGCAWVIYFKSRLISDQGNRWAGICRAIELAETPLLVAIASKRLNRERAFETSQPWSVTFTKSPRAQALLKDSQLTRSLVLKTPGEFGEKGVLFVHFEYNLLRLLGGLDTDELKWLTENYRLVVSTSWSPTEFSTLAWLLSRVPENLLVSPCNRLDVEKLQTFNDRIHCTNFLPCDWTNADLYAPKGYADRTTDIVMVANWGGFKRHWEFFYILKDLPADLKIVCIGQSEGGRDISFIRKQAAQFNVPQQIEFHQSLRIEEVGKHMCNAKVSLIFSRREGCCVAAAESIVAGCAMGMRSDAYVGSLAHINSETGMLLRPGRLAEDIKTLLDIAKTLRPREWAVRNCGHLESGRKLNEQLKREEEAAGRPWTRDISTMHWRPFARYSLPEERERSFEAYRQLHQKFPHLFSETPPE
jgi:glycosyltransferase involved in cell wall biosynthesis